MSARTGPTVRLRTQRCPSCRQKLSAASMIGAPEKVEDAMPSAGDITACIYCGAFLQFSATMRLREAPVSELAELDDAQRHNLNLVREFAREHRRH